MRSPLRRLPTRRSRSWLVAVAAPLLLGSVLAVPAGATGTGLPLEEYVNDGAAGHLWNAYDQTQDANGPDVTGRLSPVTYGATVQVFVDSDGGHLLSWANDDIGGHLWNAYDLSTLAGGGGPVTGSPAAAVQGATVDVFVEDSAGDLVEYTNDGAGGHLWNAYDLSTSTPGGAMVAGDPSVFFDGSSPAVFVRAASGDLVEYADGPDGWSITDLSTTAEGGGPVSGDPSALLAAGVPEVFVRSAGGDLEHYSEAAGSWSADDLSGDANGGGPVGADPAAISYGSTVHVYDASASGALDEYVDDGTEGATWNTYDLSDDAGGGGPVNGDASAIVYGPTVHVYVASADGDLSEYINDGVGGHLWNAYDLSQDAGGGGPIGTPPAAIRYGGATVHVYAGASGACTTNLAQELASTGSATQLITVEAPADTSTTATLTAWQLEGGCWQPVFGPFSAQVGEAGLSDHKTEGDGTTPTGAFTIGPTMYGVDPNPGVSYPYHQLVCGDWWDEDPSSPNYNTFQHVPCGTTPPFGGDSEALWTTVPAYDYFAVVDYNTDPVVPGAGSGIFLHVDTGGATAGCVSLPEPELVSVLDWLSPADNPLIVIGTDSEITSF